MHVTTYGARGGTRLVDLAGALLVMFCPALAGAGTCSISYTLSQAAKVSMNVYDSQGHVVRELLHAAPRPAGEQTEIWDGLDSSGNSLPAGAYNWKLLRSQGLQAKYLMSPGDNYQPLDGSAPGCHGGAYAVAVDSAGMYIGAGCTEGVEVSTLKQSLDGAVRLWSAGWPEPYTGAAGLASANGTLYMLSNNKKIYKYDANTGAGLGNFPLTATVATGYPYGLELDANGTTLVVSCAADNSVKWLNPADGAVLATATMPAPYGVTIASNGTVYVATGTKIVTFTQTNPNPVDWVTGLASPYRLDIDHASGDVLLFDRGSQQVKRFNAAGTLVNTYGAAGGRLDGLYVPANFRNVTDIAADGVGGFLVAEENSAPRRVAHFNGSGTLLKEWYGGQQWSPWFSPEPPVSAGAAPNAAWVMSAWGTFMRVTLNLSNNTWQVHSTYVHNGLANGLIGNSGNGQMWVARRCNGNLYLCQNGGEPCVVKVDTTNWQLLPVVVANWLGSSRPSWLTAWINNEGYIWTDANGDAFPDQSEIRTVGGGGYQEGVSVDGLMAYYGMSMAAGTLLRHTPTSFNACGAPVYSTYHTGEVVTTNLPARDLGGDSRWHVYTHHDVVSNVVYAAINSGKTDFYADCDPFAQKWNGAGDPVWQVGRKGATPGFINAFRCFVGATHGCVAMNDFNGGSGPQGTYVWDADGLWVGGLLENPDLTAAPASRYRLCEGDANQGELYTTATGDVYFFSSWINGGRVYTITGWDGIARQDGACTLASATPPHTGVGLRGDYYDNADITSNKLMRLDAGVNFDWSSVTPDPLIAATTFSVRWQGEIMAGSAGSYTFQTVSDDGARVWLEDNLLINHWNDHTQSTDTATVTLQAGTKYWIQMDYYQNTAAAGVQLQWKTPGAGSFINVPASALFPTPITRPPLSARQDLSRQTNYNAGALLANWNDIENPLNGVAVSLWENGTSFACSGTSPYRQGIGLRDGGGASSAGYTEWWLGKRYTAFSGKFHLDDRVTGGNAQVQIIADGVVKAASAWLGTAGSCFAIDHVDLSNVDMLRIQVVSDGWGGNPSHYVFASTISLEGTPGGYYHDALTAAGSSSGTIGVVTFASASNQPGGNGTQPSIHVWGDTSQALKVGGLAVTGVGISGPATFGQGAVTWTLSAGNGYELFTFDLARDDRCGALDGALQLYIDNIQVVAAFPLSTTRHTYSYVLNGNSTIEFRWVGGTSGWGGASTPYLDIVNPRLIAAGALAVVAPASAPVPGIYANAPLVSLSTTTAGATIRYTTDGSTPSQINGTVYSSPLSISATTTLKAMAYKNGMASSAVINSFYTISSNVVAKAWEFTTTAESWGVTAMISGFSWETGGYVGGMITGSDPNITSADNLSVSLTTAKIISVRLKNATLSTAAKVYFITTSDTSWNEAKAKAVTITPNSDFAEYILDMSSITGWTGTLRCLRIDPSDVLASSGAFSIDYIRISDLAFMCAAPTFSLAPGTYLSAQLVTLGSATAGATIRYTLDGSTPSQSHGAVYGSPVAISVTATLKAIAYKSGMPDSVVAVGGYSINSLLADSVNEFSAMHGQNHWTYGYYDKPSSSTFVPCSWNGSQWSGAEQYCLVWNTGGHPGSTDWSVRRWVAEVTGTIHITGTLGKGDTSGGDGIVGRILVNGVEQWAQAIAYNNGVGVNYSLDLTVAAHDNVDFAIDGKSNYNNDSTTFTATISGISPGVTPTVFQFTSI